MHLELWGFYPYLFFTHTVLVANASPPGFVPQVGTLSIFMVTKIPLQSINPSLFFQIKKLHRK